MSGKIRVAIRSALLAAALGGSMVAAAATPAEQQAIVQTGNGGPEVLKLQTVPVLAPGAGEVLIRVYAASVNPIDWKIRQGMNGPPPAAGADGGGAPGAGAQGAPAAAPAPAAPSARIPGFDVAGVVEKVGAGVTNVKPGDKVFATLGMSKGAGLNGGYAQYAIAPAETVVAKPARLTFAEAAGLGTAGGTGARNLAGLGLSKGQTVLITGVSGGVGSSAAQVAIAQGVHVVGTASPRHAEFLKSIGVTDVLDYNQSDWADKARAKGIDAVLDTVGGDSAKAAFGAIKKGGAYAGVGEPRTVTAEMCKSAGVSCVADGPGARRSGPSQGDLLKQLADLAAAGKFAVHVQTRYPLAQAGAAQEDNRSGHTEGKIVLAVTGQADSK
ncbi:MAG: NADP-dependent oxidoreductase [Steroidobacteraceae bacterium]